MSKRTGNRFRFTGVALRLIWLLWLFLPSSVYAQTLSATVSRNPVGVNEQFELKFTLEGAGGRFKAPSLADFNVLSGPNQSQNFSVINGAMSQSISFSYILQPKKEGTFRIEPAKVDINGKEIASAPITLSVVKGQGGQQGGQQGQGEKTNISTNNIFIRVTVDKSSVYQGEAVVVTFKLYSNVPLINYAISKAPSFNGFWNHDLEMPSQLQLRNETFNGVNYQVGEIKKVVLYPQQSGALTIDPMEGEVIARVQVKRTRSNNPFDIFNDPFFNDPFFGAGGFRDVRYMVKSEPVRISVKELPPNAPSSFQGAVGAFSMEASIDKPSLKANDAATLKVKISGKGNMKLIEAPVFNISADIESYDPKTEDNISFTGKGASGSRVFEYLLIPRVPGKYELGEAEFTYFDPSKKQYVTLKKGPFILNVARGEGGGVAVTGTGKADFRVLGRDIRYIKTGPVDFIVKGDSLFGSWLFWILTLLPLGILGGLSVYYRKHREELANVALFRARKAGSMAVKRLSSAKKSLDNGDTTGFYTETYKALWDYCAHKLRIPVSALTREQVAAKLTASGTPPEMIKAFEQLIDTCEMSRFAAGSLGRTPAEIYSEAVDIITRIENETGK